MTELHGLMMDYSLDIPSIWRRTERYFATTPVLTQLPDKTIHEYTYGAMLERAARLAVALSELGVKPGDRVATFAWNTYHHLELYFAVPSMGAVMHTVNLRLHPNDLVYIMNHAGDKVVMVDRTVMPLIAPLRDRLSAEHLVVVDEGQEPPPPGWLSYQTLIAGASGARFQFGVEDERQAAALCYTSGTTGLPKGVLYSHRSILLHSLAVTNGEGGVGVTSSDTLSLVTPMFHVNGWGYPWAAALQGAKQVLPGRHLDPESLLTLFERYRVTMTAGVPTVWLPILHLMDQHPGQYDLSALRQMLVGGAAMPETAIRGFQERHGIRVVHAWGMTETSPLGSVSSVSGDHSGEDFHRRATQGRAVPLVEMRVRDEAGQEVPWDGQSIGELEVRGPWIASAYYELEESQDRFTADGWFKTGDIVSMDPDGYMTIQDRSKDVIKSGGEWISSVALENAIMGYPAVLEAAVIAMPDPKWLERPLAVVVPKPGETVTLEELREYLGPHFARWWLPDRMEIVDSIPKSAAGKFLKTELRRRFAKTDGTGS
jgi:fatty-acyl-CoA synthase